MVWSLAPKSKESFNLLLELSLTATLPKSLVKHEQEELNLNDFKNESLESSREVITTKLNRKNPEQLIMWWAVQICNEFLLQ